MVGVIWKNWTPSTRNTYWFMLFTQLQIHSQHWWLTRWDAELRNRFWNNFKSHVYDLLYLSTFASTSSYDKTFLFDNNNFNDYEHPSQRWIIFYHIYGMILFSFMWMYTVLHDHFNKRPKDMLRLFPWIP